MSISNIRTTALRNAALTIATIAIVSGPASAQYFGQNKVQYKTFDFEVMHTDHFDIYFYPAERAGVEIAARMAERWNTSLSQLLTHRLSSRQPLILYASSSDFQQTNVIQGALGEGTGGVTESARRRIVLPFAGPLADTDHVIGHELVHAFQYDIAAERTKGSSNQTSGIERLPLWFIEGMAEYLSLGSRSPLTSMWIRDAVIRDMLPTINDLNDPKYFPYRWGQALWAYIGGRWGDAIVVQLLEEATATGSTDEAFENVLGMDDKQLSADWQAELRRTFGAFTRESQVLAGVATLLTPDKRLGGNLNVSPALSPDGRRVAYLSERSLFSVDLYVADAMTGENVRRLTSTDVDPHFSSLQFISSAGAWDPRGNRLAVAAVTNGRPALAIYNVENGRREQEIALGDLDGALNPAWSPDGTRIAFVGMRGGLTDLFVCDVSAGSLTRLTDDPFAELHPAWSPDGRSIAFSSDRFTTNLGTISTGPLRLAILQPATRQVVSVAAFTAGKQTNPQWSTDGRSLNFIGDPDGISNVYLVDVQGGGLRQVTDVATGVSGITESSPALSAMGDRIAFSVFDDGAYRLYATSNVAVRQGRQIDAAPAADAAQLPPVSAQGRTTTVLLSDPTTGSAAAQAPETEPYHPRLGLEYVAQPSIAIGADRFGAFGGGGMAFVMSDLLGDHLLATAVQSVTSFDDNFSGLDVGAAVMYQNLRRRWNWGVTVDQTPYRNGFITTTGATVSGVPAIVEETFIQRQADRGVTGMTSYAINRAQRVEFSGAFRNLAFDERVRRTAVSLVSGDVLFDERQRLNTMPGLNLAQAGAALVYDTSSFGATSPVLGQRYRFEVSPTFGSLRYTGALADYRRYFMPVRLYTVAARVMHYGRYGGDAEDSRLLPIFIGYPSLVRGYDVGSVRAGECPPRADGACPTFDQLVGFRMLVGNLEFRFPLLRPFGLRDSVYGPLPVEVALFADGGVAWNSGESPAFLGGNRRGVSSVGAALRANVFGFAVVEMDYSRPLQRPERGWIFQFSLSPGF